MKNLMVLVCLSTCIASHAADSAAVNTVFTIAAGDSDGLAEAIEHSNATPGADIIELAPGLYTLKQTYATAERRSALPPVRGELLIRGRSVELRAYSKSPAALLHVERSGNLHVYGLTLAEGGDGALLNFGKASLRGVSIVDQSTRSAEGILANYGELSLDRCELSYNTVSNAVQNAGTIINFGLAGIRNTQFRGNVVSRRFETLALASVIMNYGQAELRDVTLSDNQALSGLPTFRLSGLAQAFVNKGQGQLSLHNVSGEAALNLNGSTSDRVN